MMLFLTIFIAYDFSINLIKIKKNNTHILNFNIKEL